MYSCISISLSDKSHHCFSCTLPYKTRYIREGLTILDLKPAPKRCVEIFNAFRTFLNFAWSFHLEIKSSTYSINQRWRANKKTLGFTNYFLVNLTCPFVPWSYIPSLKKTNATAATSARGQDLQTFPCGTGIARILGRENKNDY